MMEEVPAALREWESFYVIVGSSAGALTGLQFVVLTLISESGRIRGTSETMSAFASPNVVHFCVALLVSAILSAPWHGLAPAGVALIACGLGGFLYSLRVLLTAMRQKDYKPVLEDWIWHTTLPILAYAALAHSGLRIARESTPDTLFIPAAAVLLLVFIGIHNAWDTVLYMMIERGKEQRAAAAAAKASPAPAAPATPPPSPPVSPSA